MAKAGRSMSLIMGQVPARRIWRTYLRLALGWAPLALLLGILPIPSTSAQDAPSPFMPSNLPPPETEKPPAPSIYDVLVIDGDTSPRGTKLSSVPADEVFNVASDFLLGQNGHVEDPKEAAFWLKRAIAVGSADESDDIKKRRAWAASRLGFLLWEPPFDPKTNHPAALMLWELAGAWNEPFALCKLGDLSENGDREAGVRPNRDQALVWYERAKAAGCEKADEAIARLKR
jgi:hypothetical protein